MDFGEYIKDVRRRKALAAALHANSQYLWQIGTGRRKASPDLANRIERATQGIITRVSLRPDIFTDPRC